MDHPAPLWKKWRCANLFLLSREAPRLLHRSTKFAPPWRFSAGGRASISGIASGSVQPAPRCPLVMPGGRVPASPLAAPSRGRRSPLPAPPFRIVSRRRPSMSEDGRTCTLYSLRSQYSSIRRRNSSAVRANRWGMPISLAASASAGPAPAHETIVAVVYGPRFSDRAATSAARL